MIFIEKVITHGLKNKNESSDIMSIELAKIMAKIPEAQIELIKFDSKFFSLIPEDQQTPEICLFAVDLDGNTLEYVKKQTPEICLEAVRQNENAITLVRNGYR